MVIGTLPIERLDEFSMLLASDTASLISSASNAVLLAASENGEPAGILAAFCEPEELHIVWIFVAQKNRRRGIGGALVRTLARGSNLLTGQITCSFIADELCAFFERTGFGIEPNKNEAGRFTTTLKRLSATPFWAVESPPHQYIIPFREVEPPMVERYLMRYSMAANTYLPPFDSGQVDPEISHALVYGGDIQGIVACARCGDGLEVLWMHFQQKYSSHMPALIREVYRSANRLLSPDAPVTMHVVNEASRRIAQKLIGDAEFVPQYEAIARLSALRVSDRSRLILGGLPNDTPDWFLLDRNNLHR